MKISILLLQIFLFHCIRGQPDLSRTTISSLTFEGGNFRPVMLYIKIAVEKQQALSIIIALHSVCLNYLLYQTAGKDRFLIRGPLRARNVAKVCKFWGHSTSYFG